MHGVLDVDALLVEPQANALDVVDQHLALHAVVEDDGHVDALHEYHADVFQAHEDVRVVIFRQPIEETDSNPSSKGSEPARVESYDFICTPPHSNTTHTPPVTYFSCSHINLMWVSGPLRAHNI